MERIFGKKEKKEKGSNWTAAIIIVVWDEHSGVEFCDTRKSLSKNRIGYY